MSGKRLLEISMQTSSYEWVKNCIAMLQVHENAFYQPCYMLIAVSYISINGYTYYGTLYYDVAVTIHRFTHGPHT